MTKEFDAMKRLEKEDLLPLKKARPLFPGSLSTRTLQRYATSGYHCPVLDAPIFLEAFRGPGRSWWTSRQAVYRFRSRLNGEDV
jgi:hypothetical protein